MHSLSSGNSVIIRLRFCSQDILSKKGSGQRKKKKTATGNWLTGKEAVKGHKNVVDALLLHVHVIAIADISVARRQCPTFEFLWLSTLVDLTGLLVQSNLSLRPPDKSDHLKIADTQFQSLEFADSNGRSAFLKMRPPEKCDLRTPKVGPKRLSNLQKATTYVKLSEKHFFDCRTFPSQELRTSDHRVCKLRLARSLPITLPLTRGNHRSLIMSWLVQGHVYNPY